MVTSSGLFMVYSRCCVAFFVAGACPFAARFLRPCDLAATIPREEISVSPGAARRARKMSQSCDTLRVLRTRRDAETGESGRSGLRSNRFSLPGLPFRRADVWRGLRSARRDQIFPKRARRFERFWPMLPIGPSRRFTAAQLYVGY